MPIFTSFAIFGRSFNRSFSKLIIGQYMFCFFFQNISCCTSFIPVYSDKNVMTNGHSHYNMLELQPYQMITFLSLQLPENDPRLPADATRIFYTNAEVDAYKEKLRNISGQMFVSKSVISSPLGCHPKILNGRVDDSFR